MDSIVAFAASEIRIIHIKKAFLGMQAFSGSISLFEFKVAETLCLRHAKGSYSLGRSTERSSYSFSTLYR